jgi:hypothetical protein
VLEGLVSIERAAAVYGVILDAATQELDRDATRARRAVVAEIPGRQTGRRQTDG